MDIYEFADAIRNRTVRFTCANCGGHKLLVGMRRNVWIDDTGERVEFKPDNSPYYSPETIDRGVCATRTARHEALDIFPNTGCGWSGSLEEMIQEYPDDHIFPNETILHRRGW
jgi:hypothetical protein